MQKRALLTLALGVGLLFGASSNVSAAPITGTIVHNAPVRGGGFNRGGQGTTTGTGQTGTGQTGTGTQSGTGQQGSRFGNGQQGLRNFASRNPGIANDLRMHPEWARDRFYLQSHPELQFFLSANPGIFLDFGGLSIGVGFGQVSFAPPVQFVGWYGGNYWDRGRCYGQNRFANNNFQRNNFQQNNFQQNNFNTGNFQPGRVPGRGLSLPNTNGNTNGVPNAQQGFSNNRSGFSNQNFSNGRTNSFSNPNFSNGRTGFSTPNFSSNRMATANVSSGRNFSTARPSFSQSRGGSVSSGRSSGRGGWSRH